MITTEIKKLIEENPLAFATVNKEGNPHCIAVAFVKVISKNQIIITNNYMVNTIKNIKGNNNVALAVWNKKWKEKCIGYELRGIAEYFQEGRWYQYAKNIPENKEEPCKGVILIIITNIKKLA